VKYRLFKPEYRMIINSKALFSIVLIAVSVCYAGSISGAPEHRLFGGGMALQAGYVRIGNEFGSPQGVVKGLGGRLHFYLGNHWRVGGGGAAVSFGYKAPGLDGSYVRLGYGGITAEATGQRGRWRYSAGVLAGGGAFDNLHLISETGGGRYEAVLDHRATMIVSPLLTLERSMTDAISLMIAADFLWGPHLGDRHHLGGPKVHFGVLFNK
jgi:hypothetical protein